ncbi:MAG TPA: dienelactone hydrolase family protein [Candidatus Binatia bacterium]|jgi:carboxymethylenebutenolidase
MGWESVKVDGGTMRLYVSRPDGPGPFPGVVVIQGQKGVDRFIEEFTQRLAAEGYAAVAPELYHRDPPDCRDDAPTRRARLRDTTVISDVNAAAEFLKRQPSVDGDRLAITGFCMGGRVSYLMAAAGSAFKAAVDHYGGGAFAPWGDGPSPFERTAEIHCPIMGHFGLEDENPSPEDVRRLDAELTKHGKVHEFFSYPDTGHAFMDPYSDKYRPHSAAAAWPRTLEFFARHLAPPKARRAAS